MRDELRIPRLLAVWAPLATTFLLVTGSAPIINASINRLPLRDHEADLAAFGVFLALAVVLHSPLFVTREICIKMALSREGSRRALTSCLVAGGVVAAVELAIALTPLGPTLLGFFSDQPEVVRGARQAFLWAWPLPFLIVVKGFYQASRIRADDTVFVAIGTSLRLVFTATLGLLVAPALSVPGPVLGAVCVVLGMGIEALVVGLRTHRIAPPQVAAAAPETPGFRRFGLPLMLANLLTVGASLFYIRVAGLVPVELEVASLAAFQEVRTLLWLPGSTVFALQAITTAKVLKPEDAAPMLRFGALVGASVAALLALLAFTPLRFWVLIDLMNEDAAGDVLRLALPALMVGTALPLLNGFRYVLRGLLISRGKTRPITAANGLVLLVLALVVELRWLPSGTNGTLNAFSLWLAMMALETAILAWISRRSAGRLSPPRRAAEPGLEVGSESTRGAAP